MGCHASWPVPAGYNSSDYFLLITIAGVVLTDGGTSVVPIGQVGIFTCTTYCTYLGWRIGDATSFPHLSAVAQPNYNITMLASIGSSSSATLTIYGTVENNDTLISCTGQDTCCFAEFALGEMRTYYVYGKGILT